MGTLPHLWRALEKNLRTELQVKVSEKSLRADSKNNTPKEDSEKKTQEQHPKKHLGIHSKEEI